LLQNCLRLVLSLVIGWMCAQTSRAYALGEPQLMSPQLTQGGFTLAAKGAAAPIIVSPDDWPGVRRAADGFTHDVERVTGVLPHLFTSSPNANGVDVVLVGTIGHSALIDGLVSSGKLDISRVAGSWEAGVTTVVEHPTPGVGRALVIAGADKRGTIFGLYTLSEQIGVSPWYWWADVPVTHRDSLYVLPGRHVMPSPAVRYRGIFLNDEAPALTGWAKEKFGGKNSAFYAHIFELLLRLRANYLWPAMWDNAFNEDDLANPALADEYGIVMGTSHHEPMLRAQQEWKRHGMGAWDYNTNSDVLKKFWAYGIARNKEYESTITIGMRGDGDLAMSPTADTQLLERIVNDQRKIVAQNSDPRVKNPEIWALYKEVQEYYEKGMQVPDDVTLLWCDDNWGNIRRLPTDEERKRSGGAGIYYHFDYVGGPRSYKWINTVPITKVWEQMHLALENGADRVWIVNVGDLKPMEFPIEFFLTMARTPERWDKDHLQAYTETWAQREFGPAHAAEIAAIVSDYTKFNGRRKPEQLEPGTFSLTQSHEAERVESDWQDLVDRAERVRDQLPVAAQAAYFELVLHPVKASATVNELYIAAARNHLYAQQGRASSNDWAARTRQLFAQDAALSAEYNSLLNGRWNHMMDQTHIGYTHWNDPPVNIMPMVQQSEIPKESRLDVFPEGSEATSTELPAFDSVNRQIRTIELARTGEASVSYAVSTSAPWIRVSNQKGEVTKDATVEVSIDWTLAPAGDATGSVTITQSGAAPVVVGVHTQRLGAKARGFVENAGTVSIEAEHATQPLGVGWEVLPNFGETLSGMEALPVTKTEQACLAYDFTLLSAGERKLQAVLAPTLPFHPRLGLRYSIAVDGKSSQTVDSWPKMNDGVWAKAVSDGVHRVTTPLGKLSAGAHSLRLCGVDAGVVLERLLIYSGNAPVEYLGPPESARVKP
jgi:Glycosyl hydrolase family 115/Gylcosyl hydrolase family 115 C-terminal domain